MGRPSSPHPSTGIAYYKFTCLANLLGAWLLQVAFAARPTSERNSGHTSYAVLQTGTFVGTTGATEPTLAIEDGSVHDSHDDHEHETTDPHTTVDEREHESTGGSVGETRETPPPPQIAQIDEAGGIAELSKIILLFAEGSSGQDTDDHKLGPFPSSKPPELPEDVKPIYEGEAAEARREALGDSAAEEIKKILARLSSEELDKVKDQLDKLKELEEAEVKRKEKAEAVAAAREHLQEMNERLGAKREGLIKSAEDYVTKKLQVNDTGKENLAEEKYQLQNLLHGVKELEETLMEYDEERKKIKLDPMYHWGTDLPHTYAERSGIKDKVPNELDYHHTADYGGGESANKVFAPAHDGSAPYMRAGEPKHEQPSGPSTASTGSSVGSVLGGLFGRS